MDVHAMLGVGRGEVIWGEQARKKVERWLLWMMRRRPWSVLGRCGALVRSNWRTHAAEQAGQAEDVGGAGTV